jgi:threonine dehydrogenase-like Zn-dependent dehydrogenase
LLFIWYWVNSNFCKREFHEGVATGAAGRAAYFEDMPVPEVRPGSALLRIQASPLLSYLKQYVEGKLPFYNAPQGAFTPGTNAVGVIEAVGRDVWHLKPGQRVVFSPHFVAGENVEDPAQILMGLTAFGGGSAAVQADWRDGSLAEYALAPLTTITPADGLEIFDAAQLAVPNRFIVPFGGVQIAFDRVGQAGDANATLASLNSLRRGGRLVLMGSMTVPLQLSYSDVTRNDWEIIGQFMYPAGAYRRLIGMLRTGLLDINAIRPVTFPLAALPEAAEAAVKASNLECVVVQP